ncbi:MAG: glutamate--tRNA ligase [Candidatus Izemoplasmatales bacterium]|jgi:glutamyl-tRNA synthetase|nr:glutamate--tRNA ligase [Candidatus Izemoplasmatales bacterium]
MNKYKEIADLIFPEIKENIESLELKYPKRNLPEEAIVTRFAPSPTGFLHTGSLFTSLVSYRFAKQTKGVFFLRLEDTDQKREIKGSKDKVISQLLTFGISPDESFENPGLYGPYIQSERREIYHAVIKEMIQDGKAYPCFCTHEELNEIRKEQEKNKVLPGYYHEYAKCRNLSSDEVIKKLTNKEEFVIRFKSQGQIDEKVVLEDAIRGNIEFPKNIQDIVIMKSDGLPTYHFAHVVDDHFMRTTHVTRGEEWVPSAPIHLEIFEELNWQKPVFCHFPVIMKMDEDKRRKLSKRKDEEASVDYFLERGYPIEGFLEYLMTLANSNFEEWRLANPKANIFDFKLDFSKMSLDGALFDLEKVKSICKEVLGNMDKETFTSNALAYAKEFNSDLYQLIISDKDYFKAIINIEREQEKPRKDYEKYSDILPIIDFMYDDYYKELTKDREFNSRFDNQLIISILNEYRDKFNLDLSQEEWFSEMKDIAINKGFAARGKDYKKNPEQYLGHVGDYAEIIRVATCAKNSTPNFYDVLRILGKRRVVERINQTIDDLK